MGPIAASGCFMSCRRRYAYRKEYAQKYLFLFSQSSSGGLAPSACNVRGQCLGSSYGCHPLLADEAFQFRTNPCDCWRCLCVCCSMHLSFSLSHSIYPPPGLKPEGSVHNVEVKPQALLLSVSYTHLTLPTICSV